MNGKKGGWTVYSACSCELRRNEISFELNHEQCIGMAIHWLNPLLCKRN